MHGISGELVFACRAKVGVESSAPPAFHCKRPTQMLQQRPFLQGCPGDLSSRFGALGQNVSKRQVSHALQARTVCMGKDNQVKLRLKLPHQVNFGEQHAIMGGGSTFGKWKKQLDMTWSDGDFWTVDVTPKPGEQLEFKYVVVEDSGNLKWEDGPNRVLKIPEGPGVYEVVAEWNKTDAELKLKRSQNGAALEVGVAKSAANESASTAASSEEQSDFVKEWQGKGVGFMKSNEHSSDRKGAWNEAGLEGASLDIVQGDKSSGSWWKKLEVVRELVTGQLAKTQQIDTLVYCNIYLQWINTGAIACVEDGGHHRPNRHAEISRKIFRELEWILGARDGNPQASLVIRRMHARLPAFTAEFTTSVPLTRIRDIAHRNDIPHDLKQEIKHTIQNKLHRNAGPEDLVATEVLLSRVTRQPGQYSEAFVEQLQIFYKELKNFFNASTLTEQLEGIRQAMDDQLTSVTDTFLDRKKRLDELGPSNNGNGTRASMGTDAIMGCLHSLTGLRAELLRGLESGLRNDASNESIAMRQKWRLCEIGLEDYSFVILSRFINALEESGGAEALAAEVKAGNVARFNHPLGATVLGVRHLGLSGWQPAECLAIENELSAWQAAGVVDKEDAAAFALAASRATNGNAKGGSGSAQVTDEDLRLWALRLKATLERARRLAEKYSDNILQLYPERSEKLGRALGVEQNAIRTYAESEIRASVVYQLARLCSLLLKAVRIVSGGEGWDPLNTGTAIGTLVEIDQIVPGKLPQDGPIVLLLKSANGDEEVKAAGENVAGVILCHELPHLSHLGVRARQERVPFVTCTDEDKIANVRSLAGRRIKLDVNAQKVQVVAFNGPSPSEKVMVGVGLERAVSGQAAAPARTAVLKVGSAVGSQVLPLFETKVETGGAKAAACGRLAALSAASNQGRRVGGAPASFKVPAGTCIPFGTMEEALQRIGKLEQFHALVEASETASVDGGKLDAICKDLQALVSSARLSTDAITAVSSMFSSDNPRLIVRSSANVEDLAGMSGAGLYDSIPNVRCAEPQSFCEAVAHVWASLYTRRAILSRRMAGVPQREAEMAVLVQELLAPTLSFVLHTQSPVDRNPDLVEAEVALGLGETLAAGTKGAAWRLAISKSKGTVETLSFANFSEQLLVGSGAADGRMIKQAADYSREPLSLKGRERIGLGQRLAAIGLFLEEELQAPQDIEGCIVGGDVFIVQSRPQPL